MALSTIADPWTPRSAAWVERPDSRFAGQPDRPLFIGGCPRSGTTLLRCLLNNHPDLAVPAETNFLIPLWRFRARYGDLRRAENRRALAEWIFNTDGIGGRRIRAGTDRDEAIERLVAAPPTLGSLLAACFEIYADVHVKRRWGDKRPAYAGFIGALFELFPDAQFVNVVRDPRAAVASQRRVGFGGDDAPLAASVATWLTSVQRVDASSRRLRADQLLDVRYEDMVRDPARTLERICEFAGLRRGDAIDEMLTRERTGNFRESWHRLISQPITTATIESWRDQLTPAETALVERATAAQFERFGYRRDPELEAVSERSALREVRREQAARARKWRRHAREELKRSLYVYRHPVAAQPVPRPARAPGLPMREPAMAAAAR